MLGCSLCVCFVLVCVVFVWFGVLCVFQASGKKKRVFMFAWMLLAFVVFRVFVFLLRLVVSCCCPSVDLL